MYSHSPTPSSGPNLTRGLLALALLGTLGFFGCRGTSGGAAPVAKSQRITQFQSISSGSVDLGEGLEVTAVHGRWIRLRPDEEGPERWLNLDGLSSLSIDSE